jgi:hypothetical protein
LGDLKIRTLGMCSYFGPIWVSSERKTDCGWPIDRYTLSSLLLLLLLLLCLQFTAVHQQPVSSTVAYNMLPSDRAYIGRGNFVTHALINMKIGSQQCYLRYICGSNPPSWIQVLWQERIFYRHVPTTFVNYGRYWSQMPFLGTIPATHL